MVKDFLSLDELMALVRREDETNRTWNAEGHVVDERWHGWTLDPRFYTLQFWAPNGMHLYELDLERCRGSAEVLDWIMQVHGKDWSGANVDMNLCVRGLIRAFRDVLDPQSTMCSFGLDTTLGTAQVRLRVREFVGDVSAG